MIQSVNVRAATLLHVDDGIDERKIVARVHQRRAPSSVLIQFPDSAQARSFIEAGNGPDLSLVLVDLRLPGESGEEFVAWLRSRPDTAAVPAYILSGHAGVEEAAQRCGADGMIEKAMDYHVLVESLAEALAKHLTPVSTGA